MEDATPPNDRTGDPMTRSTAARWAGFTFLTYIAVAFPSMVLLTRATNAKGTAAQLAQVAAHASEVRLAVLLGLLSCFAAVVIAVLLHAFTRDEDRDLATLVLVARAGEGVLGAVGLPVLLALLALATDAPSTAGMDEATRITIAAFLLMPAQGVMLGAPFFAVGSLAFCWLLVRGRMVPRALAWLGVAASVVLVVGVPLNIAGFITGPAAFYLWMPMLAFEVPLGVWLLIKGVPDQARATTPT
jgi:Domain of unknown function (DUF4386)